MGKEHGVILRDKTIRSKICWSKSLARCSKEADLAFPRIFMITDDWGCFEYDIEVIHSVVFPKRKNDCTPEDIVRWLDEYHDNGMLFRWRIGEHKYGFFVNNEKYHPWKKERWNKRRTPTPPKESVDKYLEKIREKFGSELDETQAEPAPF